MERDDAKGELRRRMRGLRKSLPVEVALERAQAAAVRLQSLSVFQSAQRVALYAPVRAELGTAAVDLALRARGASVYYPRVDPEARRVLFHRVDDLGSLRVGAHEIPEPDPQLPLATALEIEVIVVPGLAFDERGGRLGYGMGYYDRILPVHGSATAVGFCYDFQLVSEVPSSEHDRPVAWVVTETRAIQAFSSPGGLPQGGIRRL